MKKDPILITRNYYIIFLQRGKQQPPRWFICKIATSKGDIIVALDYKAPITVANFVTLAEGKMILSLMTLKDALYDGLRFHR
jgi:hypothetical protein